MQREIDDLRRKLELATQGTGASTHHKSPDTAPASDELSALLASTTSRQLGEVLVAGDILDNLYNQ
jgi:hypothetical protein